MHENLLFNNKYRIPSARLSGWDYRTSAPYFVTICTKHRKHLFGTVINQKMYWNQLGQYTCECLDNITKFSKCATVVNQIVMPNHVHVIIELKNNTKDFQPNRFGPLLKNSLSSVINHFKGRITNFADENGFPSGWQARFHDHIIRDLDEYQRIFDYITDNPLKWKEDTFYSESS